MTRIYSKDVKELNLGPGPHPGTGTLQMIHGVLKQLTPLVLPLVVGAGVGIAIGLDVLQASIAASKKLVSPEKLPHKADDAWFSLRADTAGGLSRLQKVVDSMTPAEKKWSKGLVLIATQVPTLSLLGGVDDKISGRLWVNDFILHRWSEPLKATILHEAAHLHWFKISEAERAKFTETIQPLLKKKHPEILEYYNDEEWAAEAFAFIAAQERGYTEQQRSAWREVISRDKKLRFYVDASVLPKRKWPWEK